MKESIEQTKSIELLAGYVDTGGAFYGGEKKGPEKQNAETRLLFRPDNEHQLKCHAVLYDHGKAPELCFTMSPGVLNEEPLKPGEKRVSKDDTDRIRRSICGVQRACPIYEHAGSARAALPCSSELKKVKKKLGQY